MSPVVWRDAIPRIQAVAATLGIPVELPLEDAGPRPSPPGYWISISVAANSAGPMEIGYDAWIQDGQIFISLMCPVGSGMENGLERREQFAVAFRTANFASDLPEGLIYRDDQSYDPLGPSVDDGVYHPLTLIIRYKYQDRLTAPPPY